MNPEKLKPYFTYTKSQRNGLLVLFALIVAVQILHHFRNVAIPNENSAEKQQWLSMQKVIDSLGKQAKTQRPKFYPFNPNFISDFKGYQLGMSVAEIDRLLEFRKTNRYVNSASEFQNVTQVSDSLLQKIAPYFKFPDWVKNKRTLQYAHAAFPKKEKTVVLDINLATQEELKKVYGIGDGLSQRILNEKEKLGGFVSMEQMNDIWGLSEEVIANLNRSFKVAEIPKVKKIKINDASVKELSQFPYFRYALAKSIVTYRSMNGNIKDTEDLLKISGFPVDKVKIIALYLEF